MKRILLPFILLALGIGCFAALKNMKPEPSPRVQETFTPSIRALTIPAKEQWHAHVQAFGNVQALRIIDCVSQTTGEVLFRHANLEAGAAFKKNETLFRIDTADLQLAYAQAKSAQAQARLTLQTEQQAAALATTEWETHIQAYPQADTKTLDLVQRRLHVEAASEHLASTSEQLAFTNRQITRGTITAPCDSRVLERFIEQGQIVMTGTPLARLWSTDAVEIPIALSLDDAQALGIAPDYIAEGQAGPQVHIHAGDTNWTGTLQRAAGQINPSSRMLTVFIRVDNPLAGPQPLVPGLFVTVDLYSTHTASVHIIPRHLLQANSTVLLVHTTEDHMLFLQEQPVSCVRIEGDTAIIDGGLKQGDRLCTSPFQMTSERMPVHIDTSIKEAP